MKTRAQRWHNFKEHLRFKYAPRIVDWLLDKSTNRAKAWIRAHGKLRILVDNTVLHHAVTHETGWVSTGTSNWGPLEIGTGYSARIPVHPTDPASREYQNVCFLPGLAHLMRMGLVTIYTSAELKDEQFRQPSGRYHGYGYFDYNLFGDLQIESIDGHVFPTMGPSYMNLPSAEDQQRARILQHRSDKLFDALVQCLGIKNSQDAWHIHTAEKHGLFCFLTMDFKLIRTVEAQARATPVRSLTTKVLTPEQLAQSIGLMRFPPHLFSYHDASFFVRSDLSMPEGKRRPLKNYKRDRA
ncbi:hypothetical protein [Novosphingobium sediminicola]|uniref:Uncharacterized protein n=1 Tax=Novosphingobium sediminicola TaxID=563162 RepID=A0A7W6CNN7_9SPHN|nr:hypothetical protein [Novosphingobium sediminicola]MBB3956301.1 hypothetical protein [Novosphingobium sediminicola]